ncbi:MAG: ABC transporter ATP-binding protein [Candidatus Neomarinimicrobiota bacterium]
MINSQKSQMNSDHIISLNQIVRDYELGEDQVVHALRGVDFEVTRNDYVSIMGPSGSGKSTLMNIIGCLDTPTSGTYKFEGEMVHEMDDNQLASIRNRRIGFVFQTFNLLPRATALRNVELPLVYRGSPPDERREAARGALKSVGLESRMEHRPNELSGGERQRVAIARALVTEPSIILADEPTGNLDSTTGEEIMEVLGSLHNTGNTILVVTHEQYIAAHAGRTIHLLDGLISDDSRHDS